MRGPAEVDHKRRAGDSTAVRPQKPCSRRGYLARLKESLHCLRGKEVVKVSAAELLLNKRCPDVRRAQRDSRDANVCSLQGEDLNETKHTVFRGYVPGLQRRRDETVNRSDHKKAAAARRR